MRYRVECFRKIKVDNVDIFSFVNWACSLVFVGFDYNIHICFGLFYTMIRNIDVGAGGTAGGTSSQDFDINKEEPFLFQENAPFS